METLEQAQARISELEGRVTALAGERDAAVQLGETLRTQLGETAAARDAATASLTELTSARDAVTAELGTVRQQVSAVQAQFGEAQSAALQATRRALLAENAGQVVPELIVGESVEALTTSVEGARAAFARVAEAARATGGSALAVPAGGGSARATSATEGMSPLEMISAGLKK